MQCVQCGVEILLSFQFPSFSFKFRQVFTIGDDQWHGDKVYVIGQSKRDVGIPSSHVTFLHLLPIHSQLPSTACIRMSIHFWVQVLQKQTTKGVNIHSKGIVILLKNIRVPHPKNQGLSSFWLCLGLLILWLHLGFLSL